MKMKNLAAAAAVVVMGVAAQPAQAALLTMMNDGGAAMMATTTPAGLPNPNDIIPGMEGWTGGGLYLTGALGSTYKITFKLIGSESGYTNTLVTNGGNLKEVGNMALGNYGSVSFLLTQTSAAVLVPFKFHTNEVGPDIANGANGNMLSARSFFVSFCAAAGSCGAPVSGNSGYLAFDDSGAGPDDNHDDWVGTFSVQAVPEPTSMMLLGAGLLGLAGLARRRQ